MSVWEGRLCNLEERPACSGDSPCDAWGWVFPVLLLVFISLIAGFKITWTETPGFLHWEVSGLTYGFDFFTLCSSDLLAGLRKHTDTVAELRNHSLFYMLPVRVLYGILSPLTVHRLVTYGFYIGSLLGIVAFARILRFPPAITCLGICLFGLTPVFVSLLFQEKMVGTSIVWCLLALCLVARLTGGDRVGGSESGLIREIILAPALTALAYETFVGTRVLAVIFWCFCLIFLLLSRSRGILWFLISSIISIGIILSVHSEIRSYLGLFSARGEGPFTVSGEAIWKEEDLPAQRVHEMQAYIEPDVEGDPFDSENPGSHLEQVSLLGASLVLLAVAVLFSRSARMELARRSWLTGFILVMLLVSLLIPLFSTTPIRAHRQFGIYLFSIVMALVFLSIAMKHGSRALSRAVASLAVAVSLMVLWLRAPQVMNWQNPDHETYRPLMEAHDQLRLLAGEILPGTVSIIQVCEDEEAEFRDSLWRSVFYASGVACRTSAQNVTHSCEPSRPATLRLTRTGDMWDIHILPPARSSS